MRLEHLVLIAQAKWWVAFSLFLLAAALAVWLLSASYKQPYLVCGNAPVAVDSTVAARWAQRDSLRLAPWVTRLGRPLDLKRGEKLFKGHCAACHKPDKDMTGPALKGAIARAPQPGTEWFLGFLTAQDSLLKAKEPYALALHAAWGNNPWNHGNMGLSTDDVAQLIAWIELYKRHYRVVY